MLNVAIDFDGVLNTYTGWNGEYDLYEPRAGVKEFLKKLSSDFCVVIFTTRRASSVFRWLVENDLEQYITEITSNKPRAMVYLDDRAVNFDGDFDKAYNTIIGFKTHWELDNIGK